MSAANAARQTRWRSKNPEKAAALQRSKKLSKLGLTVEQYDAFLKQQNGVCAICGQQETVLQGCGKVRRLAVDHCHVSSKVRGLLCFACNTAVGLLQDSPALAAKVQQYLTDKQ
jgi:hypothetical protein